MTTPPPPLGNALDDSAFSRVCVLLASAPLHHLDLSVNDVSTIPSELVMLSRLDWLHVLGQRWNSACQITGDGEGDAKAAMQWAMSLQVRCGEGGVCLSFVPDCDTHTHTLTPLPCM